MRFVLSRAKLLLIIRILVVWTGCSEDIKPIPKHKYLGSQITANLSEMVCYTDEEYDQSVDGNMTFLEGRKTLLVYLDSTQCTMCSVKMLSVWEDVIDILGREDINFCCIMQRSAEYSLAGLFHELNHTYLSFPVYFDENDVFHNDNKIMCHCFSPYCMLLNENNVIIAVGRPEDKRRDLKRFVSMVKEANTFLIGKEIN